MTDKITMPIRGGASEPLVDALYARAEASVGVRRADLLHQAAIVAETRLGDEARARALYREAISAAPGHVSSVEALMRLLDVPAEGVDLLEREPDWMTVGDDAFEAEVLCARAAQRLASDDLAGAALDLDQARMLAPQARRVAYLTEDLAAAEGSLDGMRDGVVEASERLAELTDDESLRGVYKVVACRLRCEGGGLGESVEVALDSESFSVDDDVLLTDALAPEPEMLEVVDVEEDALLTTSLTRSDVEALAEVAEEGRWRLEVGWALSRAWESLGDRGALLEARQRLASVPLDSSLKLAGMMESAVCLSWDQSRDDEAVATVLEGVSELGQELGRAESRLGLELAASLAPGGGVDVELEVLKMLGADLDSPRRQAAIFTRIGERILSEDIEPGGIEAEKAVRYLEAALEAVAGYRPALMRLMEVHQEGGFPAKHRELLRRRAEQFGLPDVMLAAARITEQALKNDTETLVLVRQAVALSSEDDLLGPESPLAELGSLGLSSEARRQVLQEAAARCVTVAGRRWVLRTLVRELQAERQSLEEAGGDSDAALDAALMVAMKALVAADPEEGFVMERLACMYARNESWGALGDLRRAELEWLELVDPEQAQEVMGDLGRLCSVALGDHDAALGWFRAALERQPSDIAALAGAGRILVRSERWHELADLHRHELQHASSPTSRASMAFRLGTLYERVLGDLEQARVCYEQVRSLNDNHLPSLFGLVRVTEASGDWARWASLVDEWSERERDDVLAGTLACELGQVLEERLGRLSDAASAYRRALNRLPKLELARLGVVRCLYRLGRHDEAAEAMAERLSMDLSAEERFDVQSAWMLISGNEQRATGKMLREFPDHYGALLSGLRTAYMVNDVTLAAQFAAHLGRVLPEGALRHGLQRMAHVLGRLSGAQTLRGELPTREEQTLDEMTLLRLEVALRDTEDLEGLGGLMERRALAAEDGLLRATYMASYARALQVRGQYDAALVVYKDALELQSEFVPAAKALKLLYELLGNREGLALACEIEGAISRDPEVAVQDFLTAGELRRRHLGDIEGAIQDLETVLRVSPTESVAFEALREIYSVRGDSMSLYSLMEKRADSVEDLGERKRLLLLMAQLAVSRLKDTGRAIQCHQRVLEGDPGHVQSLRILAELYQKSQRWEEAVQCLRRVLGASQDKTLLAMTCRKMAEILDAQLSDPRRAIEAYDAMLHHDSEHTPSLRRLGELLVQEGRWESAARAYGRVLQRERRRSHLLDDLKMLAHICLDGLKDPDRAEQCLVQAMRLSPLAIDVQKLYVQLLVRQKEADKLEAHLHGVALQYTSAFLAQKEPEHALNLLQTLLWLQDRDRAFLVSSVSSVMGLEEEALSKTYEQYAAQSSRKLPEQPIPIDMTDVTLPEGLSMSMVHLMRHGNDFFRRLAPINPRDYGLGRRTRLSDRDGRPGAKVALMWPSLFSLPGLSIHVCAEGPKAPMSAFHEVPMLIMDAATLERIGRGDQATLFELGLALAPLSMGLGAMSRLEDDAFIAALAAMVREQVPTWLAEDPRAMDRSISMDRLHKSLGKSAANKRVIHALEVSGKLDGAGVLAQRRLLQRAFERLALIPIFDPTPILRRLKDAHGDERLDDLASYILAERYATLRRAVRVAL